MGGGGGLNAALTGVKALSQIAGGMAANSAGNAQGQLYDNEALAQMREGDIYAEDARLAAIQRAREVTKFQAQQAHGYASSGVQLRGTPALVLEETRKLGQQEVDALIKRGQALQNLMYMRARNTQLEGAAARSTGRASMIGSMFGAVGTGLEGYISGNRLGLYGSSSGGAGRARTSIDTRDR